MCEQVSGRCGVAGTEVTKHSIECAAVHSKRLGGARVEPPLLKRATRCALTQASVPLVITMGGGYTKPIDASVEAHADVYRTAGYRCAALGSHLPCLFQTYACSAIRAGSGHY